MSPPFQNSHKRPDGTPSAHGAAVIERFWAKVDKRGPHECWPWLGKLQPNGYGRFAATRGHSFLVHRFSYTITRGPIPNGLTLDHTCHDPNDCRLGNACPHRSCVNPAHLEPVTNGENVRRGGSPSALAARKTHCTNGHPFEGGNVRLADGRRYCMECRRERDRESKRRKNAAMTPEEREAYNRMHRERYGKGGSRVGVGRSE